VYIGPPKSRTEKPRKTKIGTKVAHVTRDSDTTFKVKRSKVNLQGAGAYCGGLPPSFGLHMACRVHEDAIETSPCNCTKPCTQTLYEPGLSQAALSVLSVDNILSADMDALRRRYHAAIESRQRVTDHVFVDDLQLIADIKRYYLNMRRFAKTYLGDFEKSSFAKVVAQVRCRVF